MPTRAPKKSLGQHFLADRRILEAIADSINVSPDDTVVEIGPGRGALTAVLARRAHEVVGVEIDTALARDLRESMPSNVRIMEGDARAITLPALLGSCRPYKLLGNLPYYAAMPILRVFLESACRPLSASVLVQREVAQQMCARPGSMSLLSLGVQLFGSPRITRVVKPGSFYPIPQVTSAVVAIDVYDSPVDGITDTAGFFELARAGFRAPRKQLRNSLAHGLGITAGTVESLLTRAGVDSKRRAETLSVSEWVAVYREWSVT